MRFTKTNVTALSGVTALLTLGAAANAQINIVNTIGNGSKWAINGSRSASQPIGYDPASVIAPNTTAEAGYARPPIHGQFQPGRFVHFRHHYRVQHPVARHR